DSDCKQAAVSVGTTAEPGNVGHCIFKSGGTTAQICSVACNPVAMVGPSGCPIDAACAYTIFSGIPELTFCGPVGSVGDGQDCASQLCQNGLSCLGTLGGQSHCRPVCRKNTDADCPSGYQCTPGASGASSVMFGYCCPTTGC